VRVFSFPWWLSFAIGFLSLSVEIVWVRIIGFGYESLPPAFSFVLGFYLVGIALGAMLGKRLCERTQNLYGAAVLMLSLSALVDVVSPAYIVGLIATQTSQLSLPALVIICTSAFKSALFPIVHHLGSVAAGPRVGRSMSRIYFGNIMGATLGPLFTGFLVFDYLSTDECLGAAAAIALLGATACVLKISRPKLIAAVPLLAWIIASVIAMEFISPGAGSLRALATGRNTMTNYIANRHGIIHTAAPYGREEYVFGGNVYDGMATTNVDANPNSLDRVYLLALVHPNLKRVLTIGLSGGAWVRALEGFPGIETIDVIEINPAYVDLARHYPELSGFLNDPRVHIHIDDGRRWLRRNPTSRFDAIVQNTTFHWRANAGNLLSREYFVECRQHLNPGGVMLGNTTGSYDVFTTARSVFPDVYRYTNFVFASDHPLAKDMARLWEVRRPDGKLFQPGDTQANSVVVRLASLPLEPAALFLARHKTTGEIITDDNLLSEYRDGRRFGSSFLQSLLPPTPKEFPFID
jgi:predicted membrane-bound spermidine synthase